MRTDVKLGVAFSMAVVLVAGVYYFYRDAESRPITLADRTATDSEPGKKVDAKSRTKRPVAAQKPATRRVPPSPRNKPTRSPESSDRPKVVRRTPAPGPASTQPARSKAARPQGPVASDSGERMDKAADQPAAPVERNARERTGSPVPNARLADAGRPAATDRAGRGAAAPVRRTPEPAAGNPADVAVDLHHVQSGDTFAGLAKTYYGSERFTQLLIDTNPQVPDPNHLRVGMKIKIPPAPNDGSIALAARSAPAPAKASGGAAPVDVRRTYTVKPGDSFYAIARDMLGDATRWKELLAMNSGLVDGDPKRLRPGQVMALPPK